MANDIFAKTKYVPDEKDIASLAETMALVEAADLSALNERLTQTNRKIFDTIAELNFAAMLIRHNGRTGLEYEPSNYGPRPVDFRFKRRDVVMHLQMKRFGDLERDNRKDALCERVKQQATAINVPKFFGVVLDENFSETHIPAFIQFITSTATGASDGHTYHFKDGDSVLVTVEFWNPRSVNLPHLTLGVASDARVVNISGLAADQIRSSLRKAAAAFIAPVDYRNLNLVIAESDRHHDIDIWEACFGTEEELFGAGGLQGWHRLGDGVFAEELFVQRVAGVVVLRRPDRYRPVSDYDAVLLINEPHLGWVDQICEAMPIEGVVRHNMRP